MVEPWAAVICGFVCAWVLIGANKLAAQVRRPAGGGAAARWVRAWGVLFMGLFARQKYVEEIYGAGRPYMHGLFMGGSARKEKMRWTTAPHVRCRAAATSACRAG